MERLSFGKDEPYSAIEVAIHSTRYMLAQPFCDGRVVLDLACGEGYGSHLLQKWGAKSVIGVDISKEAVNKANKHFSDHNTNFLQGAAGDLVSIVGGSKFDLIVSLETIEHLADPIEFLENIKLVAARDATIIITCPNDHYYYPSQSMQNPFHMRKYTSSEFFDLVGNVLGPPSYKLMGFPVHGYVNSHEQMLKAGRGSLDFATMSLPGSAFAIAPSESGCSWDNCSYFAGIWQIGSAKLEPIVLTGVLHAEPMPAPRMPEPPPDIALKTEVAAKHALLQELRLSRKQVDHLWVEVDTLNGRLSQVPWRVVAVYLSIRRFIPRRLLSAGAKVLDLLRGLRK